MYIITQGKEIIKMNINVKLEQSDFYGNKGVFDCLYELSRVINRNTEPNKAVSHEEIEERAGVVRNAPEKAEKTEQAEKAETESAEETETYTLEQVRAAVGELAKKKSREKAKELLTELGYSKVTDIPEDKYTEVMSKIAEVK
jgi:hypothetical protein